MNQTSPLLNARSHYANLLGETSFIIANSENQELTYHAQNTVQWAGILTSREETITVSAMKPEDQNLQVAAFTHEIERAMNNSLHPHDFQSYSLYKQASLIRSSEIMTEIMIKLKTPAEISNEIIKIMRLAASDDNSDERAVTLREADILSFFSLSLPRFFVYKISDKLLQEICMCEFKRLTPRSYKYLTKFNFSDVRLKYYINIMFKEVV